MPDPTTAPNASELVPVTGAGFSIVLKNGVRYGAGQILTAFDDRRRAVVVFTCSGQIVSKLAEDVERIEFYPDLCYCPHCDQRLDSMRRAP